MNPSESVFEVIDPRGYKIICTEDCWKHHILANRPFMKEWIDEIKQAIEKPVMGIFQDATYKTRNVYYGDHEGKTRYVKVVVDFAQEDLGYVVTAYPDSSGREGEFLIWPIKSKA